MEIALIIIGIMIFLGLLNELITKFKSANWAKFFGVLILGSILLAVIFSFTSEGVLVIVGAYVVLVILAMLFGVFSKKSTKHCYEEGIVKGRYEVAKNLLDVLDDQTISNKTKLSISDVKALRLKS